MKHTLKSAGTILRVLVEFTSEEVRAFPHAACAEGLEITLDLPMLGGMCSKAIRSKMGRAVEAGGALVVKRAKVKEG